MGEIKNYERSAGIICSLANKRTTPALHAVSIMVGSLFSSLAR